MRHIVFAAMIFLLQGLPAAASCPCMQFIGAPAEQFQAWADSSVLVFEAGVESVVESPADAHGLPAGAANRTATLQVYRWWKGSLSSKVVMESRFGDCSFRFEAGRQYLVFAILQNGRPFAYSCAGTIPLNDAAAALDYFAKSTGAVCGQVRGRDGLGAGEVTVAAWRPRERQNLYRTWQTITGDDGRYMLGLLKPGKYPLMSLLLTEKPPDRQLGFYQRNVPRSDEEWTVEIEAGKEACGFDFDLVRQPLLSLTGTLKTEDGSPVPGECRIFLHGVTRGHPLSFTKLAFAKPDGTFVFEGVPHARVYVYANCFKKNEDGSLWGSRPAWIITGKEIELILRKSFPKPPVAPVP